MKESKQTFKEEIDGAQSRLRYSLLAIAKALDLVLIVGVHQGWGGSKLALANWARLSVDLATLD